MQLIGILCYLYCLVSFCWCAKILGIFPNCGYSQFILGGKLMRELAARGHEVTVISPFPSKVPIKNYRDVSTEGVNKYCNDWDLFDLNNAGPIGNTIAVNELGFLLTDFTFQEPKVKNLLNSNATFDLVICEQFFNYAQMSFAHHYKAALVLMSSQGPNEWTGGFLQHPLPFSYVPFGSSEFSYEMTFLQRLQNSCAYLFYDLYDHFVVIPRHDAYLDKHMPNSTKISELIQSIDLVLYNSHVSANVAVPTLPNMIEIGGFHVDPKPLPEDLQKFLDDAKEGVIYFSMGSNLKSTNMPKEKFNAFMKVFSTLKQKILWKWEDEYFDFKPDNIKIGKWLPQQDILAHPNVKLFITHCGLLSTIESIYFGVPFLGIPIFGDQRMNCAVAKSREIGLTLNYNDITEENLFERLTELLNNPKYTINAKFGAQIMSDQPMKPMDKAIFWIEYVLRHKGAKHLQPYSMKLSWYKYYLLDILVLILLAIITAVVIFVYAINKLSKCIKNTEKVKLQ